MFHFNHLSFINKGEFSALFYNTFVGFAYFVIPGKTLKEREGKYRSIEITFSTLKVK